ncbi:MAG: roadblock/LC7 domain-containing protein, partial [Candidatus Hermodarchaeota archaeon]
MLNDDAEIMDRLQEIERILRDVQSRIPDLEGLAVVTRDGLPIASALYTSTDEDRISAMTAASLSLSERVV